MHVRLCRFVCWRWLLARRRDRVGHVRIATLNRQIKKTLLSRGHKIQTLHHTTNNKPPTLAKQYPAVTSINIERRLQRSTSQLKDWMAHLKHQIKMTELILAQRRPPGQMTIQEAFKNATARRDAVHKYPPQENQIMRCRQVSLLL